MTLVVGLLMIAEATTGLASAPLLPPSLSEKVPVCRRQGEIISAAKITDFERAWYTKHLAAANEPPLLELHGNTGSSVRFTWLRSFDTPIIVRIEGLGTNSPQLAAIQLTGRGGYDPGIPGQIIKRRLKPEDVADLTNVLAKSRFLHPPSPTTLLKDCVMSDGPPPVDGAEWVLEAVDGSGYHFERDTSPKIGEVRTIGMMMLGLTGLALDPIY